MAQADRPHPQLPPALRTLARPSDQEALELELSLARSFPQLSITSTNQNRNKIYRWWKRYISMGVPHVACRDHLGKEQDEPVVLLMWIPQHHCFSDLSTDDIKFLANERTFLGYLRTGQAFAVMGVIIAQVMRLTHSPNPNPVLGFFVVSIPLSCDCHSTAIILSALGAIRFLRYQQEMARGHAVAGGWEIKFVGTLTTLVSTGLAK